MTLLPGPGCEQPITFVHRNLVWGRDREEVWAVYRLAMAPYEGRIRREKIDLLADLAMAGAALERDFTLLRVTRPWSVDAYVRGARLTLDRRHGHAERWHAYLDAQRDMLDARGIARPEAYLSVRLSGSARTIEERLAAVLGAARRRDRSQLRRLLGLDDPRAISRRELERLLDDERRVSLSLIDYLDCEPASTRELQWLIRRGLCRGVGEPEIDEQFLPQALVLDDDGEQRFVPLEHDLLRLFDAPITIEPRGLLVESELGDSHQAFLTFGALPDAVEFPGRRAELLFAPLEALDFPVDAAFSARFVPNDAALALTRKRIIDADNIWREENLGDHGPGAQTAERPQAARELEQYLTDGARPPLLRAAISLAVGAPTRDELEQRVERVRREYAGAPKLMRPLGDQLRLFCGHLPGQPSTVPDYDDYLTVEQFGAMVPIATSAVGSGAGPYIGRTLSATGQPVLLDLSEAARASRPPSILCAGTPGGGKTMLLQLLLYQAFLQGSVICDIDPKGDHRLCDLPGLAEHTEVIELAGHERWRGLLDPLRIGDDDAREDLATNFLIDLLPAPFPAEWRTEIRRAVQAVVAANRIKTPSCRHVLHALAGGSDDVARAAGRAIEVYADTGLAQLGFAAQDSPPPLAGSKQITSIRIRRLPRPLPGTPRSELSEDERIGQAVLRLLAAYAMRLMSTDRTRHKVLGFDEAWFLLQDAAGRRLVEHLNRWGRSEFATPILLTHLIADVEEIDNLIGARFIFGQESDSEAAKALALLRLDADDERLRQRLLSYREGRAMFRDYDGRVAAIHVDPGAELLAAFDTTPGTHDASADDEIAA